MAVKQMKYEDINQADKDFIDKLPKLRDNLADRQKNRDEEAIQKSRRHLLIQIVVPILVAAVGIAAIYLIPEKQPPVSNSDDKEVQTATVPMPTSPGAASPAAVEKKPPTQHKTASPDRAPDAVSRPNEAADVRPPGGETEHQGTSKNITAAKAEGRGAALEGIKLVSAAVCNAVKKRQPLGEQKVFRVGDHRRAYVWMEIQSNTQPFVVKHIYYLNGREYTQVPLDIKYPRMRTWSYLTIDKPKFAGSWRVDIVCQGSILKTVEFQITAGSDS